MVASERFTARTLIDHEHVSSPLIEVHNPAAFRTVVGHAARTTAADAERAVSSAHAAGPGWAALSLKERAALVTSAVPDWEASLGERALTLTREQGKVLWESVADSRGPQLVSEFFARTVSDTLQTTRVENERGITITRHVPFGVTAVIVPWNYPVYLAFQHIAPALISGNTVVVKPPEFAPLSLGMVLEALSLRLPRGVLNIVPGSGSVIGPVLTTHPLVRKILFTGSTPVGRSILHAAADSIKSVGLELGGNDPAIVLPGATLSDERIREIVRGVFTCTGQVCFDIKRVYVHDGDYADFVERFSSAVNEIRVGDGLDPASTMGPINNAREYERLQGLLSDVQSSGARVDTLGSAVDPSGWNSGYFMRPSVVTNIDPEHELVQEEQFGPIIPVLPYKDVPEVIAEVNRSEFGLCASVWDDDVESALTVGEGIAAGTVFVNAHRMGVSDMTMPFGGVKQSGLGRTHAQYILLECTEPQVLAYRADLTNLPGPQLAAVATASRA